MILFWRLKTPGAKFCIRLVEVLQHLTGCYVDYHREGHFTLLMSAVSHGNKSSRALPSLFWICGVRWQHNRTVNNPTDLTFYCPWPGLKLPMRGFYSCPLTEPKKTLSVFPHAHRAVHPHTLQLHCFFCTAALLHSLSSRVSSPQQAPTRKLSPSSGDIMSHYGNSDSTPVRSRPYLSDYLNS